jgi:predicted DNA-binding transcriptional regulator AlpA
MRLADLRAWLAKAPSGTMVAAHELLSLINDSPDAEDAAASGARPPFQPHTPETWRERLWTVPADTRLGVRELVEATGRSRDWVYRHTAASGTATRLPHRTLDGELVFLAGEVRGWLVENEQIIEPGGRAAPRLMRS